MNRLIKKMAVNVCVRPLLSCNLNSMFDMVLTIVQTVEAPVEDTAEPALLRRFWKL
jgi:hypothetical protein